MEFEYWIEVDGDLKNVTREEFYNFDGKKHLFPKGRGPGWYVGTAMLCDLADRNFTVPDFLEQYVNF